MPELFCLQWVGYYFFSLSAVKYFFFVSSFQKFNLMYLGLDFFEVVSFRVCLASWICSFSFLPNMWSFQPYFPMNFLALPSSHLLKLCYNKCPVFCKNPTSSWESICFCSLFLVLLFILNNFYCSIIQFIYSLLL